ncbi:MAG: DUF4293 domain-containing protein [Aureibaculum sp.]|nr:DUF4293 domain-containing protein [Aureibaculum sp.]
MVQRIQSLYLFFSAIISLGLIFVFALWENVDKNEFFAIDLFDESNLAFKVVPILFLLSGLMSLMSLSLFKTRLKQFVLNRFNILINLILLGILIYHLLTLSGEAEVSEKGIGVVLPIIVIVLLVLANKAIKKDEDLVKSVDRLR